MKFSLSLPLLKDRSAPDPFRETYELAVLAEEHGFDTVTIGHHHFMPGNLADPLTFLATVAARTSTVRRVAICCRADPCTCSTGPGPTSSSATRRR